MALEQYAGQFATTYTGLTMTYRLAFDRPVNAFKARAGLYFSTLAAQAKFKAACKRLDHGAGFHLIYLSYLRICDAARDLCGPAAPRPVHAGPGSELRRVLGGSLRVRRSE